MRKISVWGLNTVLATSLDGTYFFEELLSKIHPEVDEEKKIEDRYIDNIKTAIKVALRFAIKQDHIISYKLKQALKSLLDYGTEASSENIRDFLNSQESKTPLIISGMSLSEKEKSIGNLFLPARDVAKNINNEQKSAVISLIFNRVEQNFPKE